MAARTHVSTTIPKKRYPQNYSDSQHQGAVGTAGRLQSESFSRR